MPNWSPAASMDRDARITTDVDHLLVAHQLADDDVVSVEAHPHDGDVQAAIPVDSREVRQTAGFDHRPR